MNTEFWTVVINGSSNLVIAAAMVIQTIIFFVTFKFGFKYLEQHREKSKVERELDIIYDSMKKIHQLRQIWLYWCELDPDSFKKAIEEDSNSIPAIKLIGENFLMKYKKRESEWKDIRITLRVNFKLLHQKQFDVAFNALVLLEESAKQKYFSLSQELETEILRQKFQKIPTTFYSNENNLGLNHRMEILLNLLEKQYLKVL